MYKRQTYTFTHDSYRYTARRDDNGLGVCPDCDSTHEHTPYEAVSYTHLDVYKRQSLYRNFDNAPGVEQAIPNFAGGGFGSL